MPKRTTTTTDRTGRTVTRKELENLNWALCLTDPEEERKALREHFAKFGGNRRTTSARPRKVRRTTMTATADATLRWLSRF